MKKTISLALLLTISLPAFAQPELNTFLHKKTHHDPSNLPSSWQLFFDKKPSNLVWSILIPTLVERSDQFQEIFTKLIDQIKATNLEDKVEIVFFRDDREGDVGFKRNKLIENASGKYTCFVDDDDDVHNEYIPMLYEKLLEGKNCVKLIGIYHHIGHYKKPFIHSIEYDSYFEKNNIYYRPPNHLNPIKKSITSNFKFPDKRNHGEDTDWAMRICKAKVIKTESTVDEPYYFYNFDAKKSVSHQKLKIKIEAQNRERQRKRLTYNKKRYRTRY